jgi:flagellar assembly factor FliW
VIFEAEKRPFYWLQSVDKENIAFILIDPFIFRPDYEVNINNDELKDIGILGPEKALILAVVTISAGGLMTANLQGPLIINQDNHQGKQAILADPRWKIKHDIMAEYSALNQPAE